MAVRGEMDPKSDDIFFYGLNEYYSCRPHSLEDVTLAEFGSNYEVRGKKNRLTTVLILTLIMDLIPLIRLTPL